MHRFLASLFFCLMTPITGHATKACWPSKCTVLNNGVFVFDSATCTQAADWIAEGTINNVVHDQQGMPLNKDFASFSFSAKKWLKNRYLNTALVPFRVGWCNSPSLPENIDELVAQGVRFRFYGSNSPLPCNEQPKMLPAADCGFIAGKPEYIHYEILADPP